MDMPTVGITYKLANGEQICIDVSIEVQEVLEETDRKLRSQGRQDRRRLNFVGGADELDSVNKQHQEDTADTVIRLESYNRLYAAIEKLSEVNRRRIFLYHFCGLKCREIALIENVSEAAASRSLRKARKILKGYIG